MDRILAARDARALIEPALVAWPRLDVGRIDVAVRPIRAPRPGRRRPHPIARNRGRTVGDEPDPREGGPLGEGVEIERTFGEARAQTRDPSHVQRVGAEKVVRGRVDLGAHRESFIRRQLVADCSECQRAVGNQRGGALAQVHGHVEVAAPTGRAVVCRICKLEPCLRDQGRADLLLDRAVYNIGGHPCVRQHPVARVVVVGFACRGEIRLEGVVVRRSAGQSIECDGGVHAHLLQRNTLLVRVPASRVRLRPGPGGRGFSAPVDALRIGLAN